MISSRQHAEVARRLPASRLVTACTLTEVYRKMGRTGSWCIVMPSPPFTVITLEQAAALAHGLTEGEWR